MLLIIACHITQGYSQQIAFILNVGVQLFFLLSGFLYGILEIPSIKDFYKKRLVKVYIPFIIVVLFFSGIYVLFGIEEVKWNQIIPYVFNIQTFANPIEGFNHLWFLSVIMICYVLTPLVKYVLQKHPYVFIALLVLASIVEFIFIQKMYSIAAWIVLYLIGMCIGHLGMKKINTIILTIGSGICLAILMIFFKLQRLTDPAWSHYNVWLHCVMALFIFSLLFVIISRCKFNLPKWIKWINNLSYEVYLIHHIFILGPLSLLYITPSKAINILLVLFVTGILSYALSISIKLINIRK